LRIAKVKQTTKRNRQHLQCRNSIRFRWTSTQPGRRSTTTPGTSGGDGGRHRQQALHRRRGAGVPHVLHAAAPPTQSSFSDCRGRRSTWRSAPIEQRRYARYAGRPDRRRARLRPRAARPPTSPNSPPTAPTIAGLAGDSAGLQRGRRPRT
ncbi:MAG: hypothetical protein MZV64_19925, partial [Ignavibacteriales bacterium]|nr:hypothetical protein [Ignavibacteriales bacterium]